MKVLIKIVLWVSFIASFHLVRANDIIDSLKYKLANEILSDSLTGEINRQIGTEYIYTSSDSFMYYSRVALSYFDKANYNKGKIRAYVNIGNYHSSHHQVDSALYYLNTAKGLVSELDYESSLYVYFNFGYLHHNTTNQFTTAIENYLLALDYAKRLGDTTRMAVFHYNIADVFGQNDMNEKALPHNRLALQYAENADIPALKPIVTYGIGVYYLENENYDSSMYYFRKSLKMTDLESDYNSAFYASHGISESYFGEKNYLNAYAYSVDAFKYASQYDEPYEFALALCKRSKTSLMVEKNNESNEFWTQFEKMNDTLDNNFLAETCYQSMAKAHGDKGNFDKAYGFMQTYVSIKDSVFTKENRSIISELETKYRTEKKEVELEKKELIIANQKTLRHAILGGSTLLLSLALLIIWSLIQRSRKNKKLALQQSELQAQKILQLEKEQKILSMASMIEGQEAERSRIAKDLHDGLGGLLSSVKARMTTIMNEVKQIESFNIYETTTEMVDEACDEVRRISHNLMPGALRLEGLKMAVLQLSDELDTIHPFSVVCEVFGFEEQIDETKATFIYRIIQEATNNIIKYANASSILIQLFESEDEYQIVIEDDGQGFNEAKQTNGIGLRSIRSRVDFLNGTLDLDTRLNLGTTITINIPK